MSEHQEIVPSVLYFGTPVVLVVTLNPGGTANITPISSAWALGSSVVLGLGSSGQGAKNLQRTRECSLNFPAAKLWPRIESIARTTGVNPVPADKAQIGYIHEADKFSLGNFTVQKSDLIQAPRIAECPLQFEAHLLACHASANPTDNAEPDHLIVETKVMRVHAHRAIIVSNTNRIDTDKWNPLFYVFRHYFGKCNDLGRNFRAES